MSYKRWNRNESVSDGAPGRVGDNGPGGGPAYECNKAGLRG